MRCTRGTTLVQSRCATTSEERSSGAGACTADKPWNSFWRLPVCLWIRCTTAEPRWRNACLARQNQVARLLDCCPMSLPAALQHGQSTQVKWESERTSPKCSLMRRRRHMLRRPQRRSMFGPVAGSPTSSHAGPCRATRTRVWRIRFAHSRCACGLSAPPCAVDSMAGQPTSYLRKAASAGRWAAREPTRPSAEGTGTGARVVGCTTRPPRLPDSGLTPRRLGPRIMAVTSSSSSGLAWPTACDCPGRLQCPQSSRGVSTAGCGDGSDALADMPPQTCVGSAGLGGCAPGAPLRATRAHYCTSVLRICTSSPTSALKGPTADRQVEC